MSVSRPSNSSGRPSALAQPAHDHALQLRPDRRGAPQHRVLAQRGRQQLAEDPGAGGRGSEVGEEARVLPVRGVGEDERGRVGEDRADRLRRLGGVGRQQGSDRAGLDRRQDRVAPRRPRGSPRSGPRRRARPRGTRSGSMSPAVDLLRVERVAGSAGCGGSPEPVYRRPGSSDRTDVVEGQERPAWPPRNTSATIESRAPPQSRER